MSGFLSSRTRGRDTAELLVCGALTAVALAVLTWRASAYFPTTQRLLGHDWAWFLPTLVVGHGWLQQHGPFDPPYFTAALCGGVPFLGNPQSVFYSLPQLLLLVFEPPRAMLATLLLSAVVGALGCYGLLRRGFGASRSAAALAGLLFLINGFLFHRLIVGHLTYHVIAVTPLLAWSVAAAQKPMARGRLVSLTVAAGALVAYVTYGGALNIQVPLILSVAAVLLVLQLDKGFRAAPWLVLAAGCVWGVLLSAMKLAPAAWLAAQYPRLYLPVYMFQSPLEAIRVLVKGYLLPERVPDVVQFGTGGWLARHEFEFGVSLVPLLLVALALRSGFWRRVAARRVWPWLALAVIALTPLALTIGPPPWAEVLLRVPVINNNTTLVRWWLVYLLPLLVVSARLLDVVAAPARRPLLLVGCAAVAIVQFAMRDPGGYYLAQADYDPAPVIDVYRGVERGLPLPPIERIRRPGDVAAGDLSWRPNDAFVHGATAWPCYEPVFGYAFELVADFGLVDGPIARTSADGRLNLIDPATHFADPAPPAGERRFSAARRDEAAHLAAHQPYSWPEPWWHRTARYVTALTALVSLLVLFARIVATLRRPRGRPVGTS